MDAVEFFKTGNRLCKNQKSCNGCPICKEGMCMVRHMVMLDDTSVESIEEIEETVSKVEQWAKDHPVKTRQSEFLKMFPDSRFDGNGVLCIEPCCIELSRYRFSECSKKDCENCRREYWLAEVTDND